MKVIHKSYNHLEKLYGECSKCGSVMEATTNELNANNWAFCPTCNNVVQFYKNKDLCSSLKQKVSSYNSQLAMDYYNK